MGNKIFKALSDKTRREIIFILSSGKLPVKSIAENFFISREAISKHLKILFESGLLNVETIGRQRIYKLNSEPIKEVYEWIKSILV